MLTLEDAIDKVIAKHKNDSSRLGSIADYAKEQFERHGLPDVQGGAGGELTVNGFARAKDWDIAYQYAGKNRLLVSLKSLWKNASGTVPNRIDDLMGEAANVQQMSPECVIGYILLFDKRADSQRQSDGLLWSRYFERQVKQISVRKAPLWNQGLIEGCWFILIDGSADRGSRIVEPEKARAEGEAFFHALLQELKIREPAIPFTSR